jgi:hypothetical protein
MHLEIFGGKCVSSMKKCIFISLEKCFCTVFCEFFEFIFDCTCALADHSPPPPQTSEPLSPQGLYSLLFFSNLLQIVGSGTRYTVGSSTGTHSVTVQLPAGLTCSQCVLQWKYHTGRSEMLVYCLIKGSETSPKRCVSLDKGQ